MNTPTDDGTWVVDPDQVPVLIYPRALSNAEIADLYAAGPPVAADPGVSVTTLGDQARAWIAMFETALMASDMHVLPESDVKPGWLYAHARAATKRNGHTMTWTAYTLSQTGTCSRCKAVCQVEPLNREPKAAISGAAYSEECY